MQSTHVCAIRTACCDMGYPSGFATYGQHDATLEYLHAERGPTCMCVRRTPSRARPCVALPGSTCSRCLCPAVRWRDRAHAAARGNPDESVAADDSGASHGARRARARERCGACWSSVQRAPEPAYARVTRVCSLKAPDSMTVDDGIEIEKRKGQPAKAPPPISVTDAGSVIDASEVQPLKASAPICVTDSGIVIDASDLQP